MAPPGQLGQVGVVEVGHRSGVHGVAWGRNRFQRPRSLGLGLQVLDDRWVGVRVAGGRHLLLVDGLGRDDLGLEKLGDTLTEVHSTGARLETHG